MVEKVSCISDLIGAKDSVHYYFLFLVYRPFSVKSDGGGQNENKI